MEQSDNPDFEQDDQVGLETPEEEVEPQEPQMERLKLDGDEIEVPSHIAAVIKRAQQKATQTISRQGEELGQLRKQTQPAPQPPPQTTPEDEDLKFFQSPSQALKQALAEERELRRQERAFERAEEAYWDEFYRENPTLRSKGILVKTVVEQNLAYLSTLPPEQSRKEIADFMGTLLTPADQGTKKALPNKQATAERASNSPPTKPQSSQNPPPKGSVMDVLNERARRRHAALYKTPKDD